MDVTKSLLKKLFLVASVVVVIFGCGVTPSPSTPNAFVCDPSVTDVSSFYTGGGPYSVIQTNCLTCHGTSNPATNLRSRMRFNDSAQQTSTTQTENLCIAYQFGQNSPSQALVTHPQQPDHNGGAQIFPQSSLTTLINWVNTYSLPNQ